MPEVGVLTAKVVADTSQFSRGLQKASGEAKSFSEGMKSVGKKAMLTGGLMTAGMTLPIVAMGRAMINAASDLNESASKVNVVFGGAANGVQKWAETAATSLGQSKQQALEAAGTFGNLFRALGLAEQPAADMSMSMVKLAGDLASFNNVSPDEALLALRSGLVGEAEPLRKFGVSLSEARIQEQALAMGLIKSTKEALTPAAKAQAAYAIIMKDTSLAQGDFARTADGVANKQRIVAAQFEDTKAKLGTALLPIMQQFLGVLSKVASYFANLPEPVQKVLLVMGALLAVAGPLVTAFGAISTILGVIGTAIGAISGPVLIVIAVIAAVVAAIVYFWKTNENFRKGVMKAWNAIRDAFVKAWEKIQPSLERMKQALIDLWNKVQPHLQKLGDFLGKTVLPALGQAISWIVENVIPALVEGVAWGVEMYSKYIQGIVDVMVNYIIPAVQTAVAWFMENVWPVIVSGAQMLADFFMNVLWPAIQVVWAGIQTAISVAWAIIQPIWQAISDFINNVLVPIFQAFMVVAGVVWQAISTVVGIVWAFLEPIFAALADAVGNRLSQAFSAFQAVASFVWGVVQSAISVAWAIIEPIVGFLRDRFNEIKTALEPIGGAASAAFDGLKSAISTVWDIVRPILEKMGSLIGDVAGGLKGVAGAAGSIIGKGIGVLGGRATGGPVAAGTPYIVGEQGPELFLPGTNGTIIPNHKLGAPQAAATGGVTIVIVDSMDKAMAMLPPEAQGRARFLYGRAA